MTDHIPAWKRIALKTSTSNAPTIEDEDPLNITTHLSTGLLTKKDKKAIIANKPKRKLMTTEKQPKRQKLPKDQREKKFILKDQLAYLLEFFLEKIDADDEFASKLVTMETPEGITKVWKFSKQKQNWLLKHVYEFEQVPAEYTKYLVAYLKDLKGKSREELLAKAEDHVTKWNNEVDRQDAKMKALIDGEPEELSEEDKKKQEEEELEIKKGVPSKEEVIRAWNVLCIENEVEVKGISKEELAGEQEEQNEDSNVIVEEVEVTDFVTDKDVTADRLEFDEDEKKEKSKKEKKDKKEKKKSKKEKK